MGDLDARKFPNKLKQLFFDWDVLFFWLTDVNSADDQCVHSVIKYRK